MRYGFPYLPKPRPAGGQATNLSIVQRCSEISCAKYSCCVSLESYCNSCSLERSAGTRSCDMAVTAVVSPYYRPGEGMSRFFKALGF